MSDEDPQPYRIRIDGYSIRVRPCQVAVPYVERAGDPLDTFVLRDGWRGECCGVSAEALTAAQAAEMVREQLG